MTSSPTPLSPAAIAAFYRDWTKHGIGESEQFAERLCAHLGSALPATPPNLQADSCAPRRSDAAGLEGEVASLPPVGPATTAPGVETLATWLHEWFSTANVVAYLDHMPADAPLDLANALLSSGLLGSQQPPLRGDICVAILDVVGRLNTYQFTPAEYASRITDAVMPLLNSPPTASGWRPIADAPKDGTPVLLFYSGLTYVAQWADESAIGPVWCTVDATMILEPTHWQPLPESPPAQEGA